MHHPVQFQVMGKGIQEDRLKYAQENQRTHQVHSKKIRQRPDYSKIPRMIVRTLTSIMQAIRIFRRGGRVHV